MKVLCKDNCGYPLSLKIGFIYIVTKENQFCYFIVDDNQEEHCYPKELFEAEDNF
jgi:hypothetical protein